MIDLLEMAERAGFKLKGTKLSEVHKNLDAFICLDDTILSQILISEDKRLVDVQEKIRLFNTGIMYTIIENPNEDQQAELTTLKIEIRNPGNEMLKKKVFYRKADGGRGIELTDVPNWYFPADHIKYLSYIYIDKNSINNNN